MLLFMTVLVKIVHFSVLSSFLQTLITKAEDIKDLSFLELAKLGEDISKISYDGLNNDDVTLYLVTRQINEPQKISKLRNNIDNTKNSKILIHGWIENHRRSWYKNLTDVLLTNDDCNVIQVDWERPARSSYISSARDTRYVGQQLGNLILSLELNIESLHIIGHSLGAHVAGFAGKRIKEKTGNIVGRISALDPAGPYFRENHFVRENRLDNTDAEIVDVIHTDAGFYGYEFPIGTFDIYANGGQRIQPGCLNTLSVSSFGDLIQNSFCSHARSYMYFTEWIGHRIFKCRMCNSLEKFLMGGCIFPKTVSLSFDDVTKNTSGVCFTRTQSEEPFLSGNENQL